MNELGPVGIVRSSGGNLQNYSSAWRSFRRGGRKSKSVAHDRGVEELLSGAWAAFADAIRSASVANLNEWVASVSAAAGELNDAVAALFKIRPDSVEPLLRAVVDSFVAAGVEGFATTMANPANEGPRFTIDAGKLLKTIPSDSPTLTSLLHSGAGRISALAAPIPPTKREPAGVPAADTIAELGSVRISSMQLLLQSSLPAPKRTDSVKSAADAYAGARGSTDTASGKIPFEKTV